MARLRALLCHVGVCFLVVWVLELQGCDLDLFANLTGTARFWLSKGCHYRGRSALRAGVIHFLLNGFCFSPPPRFGLLDFYLSAWTSSSSSSGSPIANASLSTHASWGSYFYSSYFYRSSGRKSHSKSSPYSKCVSQHKRLLGLLLL